jgi:hypothetical protein
MHLPRITAAAMALAALGAFAPEPARSQTQKRLSAREIFYAAQAEPPPAKKAAPPQQQAAKPKKKAVVETASTKGAAPPAAHTVAPTVGVVPVSYTTGESAPLGLRYSILKREGADSVEAAADSVFRSGDRIRLRVEVSGSGYLYIIHRGSSGVWKPLFPAAETAGGDNRVERGRTYEIPAGYVFTFDEQPGEEKLFIVFSRQPEANLDELIYSLTSGQKPADAAPKVLLAQNMVNIQDGMIERMRNVYSRDLIIEKVDESSPAAAAAPAREKAVYVVNPSRSGDSRVVADVTLTHK